MIVSPSHTAITRAAEIIVSGGCVGMPTETVYGLAADATNPIACSHIFEIKNRPHFDPLIVHVSDHQMFASLTRGISDEIGMLIERFWPGPLTVVVPKSDLVPDIVTSGLPTVAIRMPRHDVALELIRAAGRPIAAPSANPFGYLSPTEAAHVEEQLGSRIEMIIDGGPCSVGVESTIVKFHEGRIHILRPGGISFEEISKITGNPVHHERVIDLPDSPGQLESHYSPRSRLCLIDEGEDLPENESAALLAFCRNTRKNTFIRVEILSETGSMHEAAANLFSALHRLDESGALIVYAERIPSTGLGVAIMDRLKRGAFCKED